MLTLTPNQPNQINVVPKKMTVTLWAFLWDTSGASFCPRRMRRPAQTTQRRCEQAPPTAKSRDGSVQPAIRIPCPTRDWIVYDRCPAEAEDKRRDNPVTLKRIPDDD